MLSTCRHYLSTTFLPSQISIKLRYWTDYCSKVPRSQQPKDEEPVRQHEKTLHFTDSTVFLGSSASRFISECSVTRKMQLFGQNAAFYILDFSLRFEIQCIFPKLCIWKWRVWKHCFCRTDPTLLDFSNIFRRKEVHLRCSDRLNLTRNTGFCCEVVTSTMQP
jgi:hypothetical protein